MGLMTSAIQEYFAVTVAKNERNTRPAARPSRIDSEAFRVLEAAVKQHYNTVTLPMMSAGATDMAYLRANGKKSFL